MTVADLIHQVVDSVRRDFYCGNTENFKRDERALRKCVARYGYECNNRGWDFSVEFILSDLMTLLREIKRTGAEIVYLPTYLEGAVDRRIRLKAEQLSDQAKTIPPRVSKVVAGVKSVEVIREPTPTEVLTVLYLNLRKPSARRLAAKADKTPPARHVAVQDELF